MVAFFGGNMIGKSAARAFVAFCIAAIPCSSSSEPVPTKTLGALAGYYVITAHQIQLIKKTKCAYAVMGAWPTDTQLLDADVLPAFPAEEREPFRRAIAQHLASQDASYQKSLETQLQKFTTQVDEKTACGVLTGMYLGMFGAYQRQWQELKKKSSESK